MASPQVTIALNERVASMQPSATLAMTARANALSREGKDIISLSAGEPDFDTPEAISQAGIQAIKDGYTNYTDNSGMADLREAITEKLRTDNDLDYGSNQILCSNGAKQSVALGIHVLCGPGEEVLIPAPYWVSYPEMVRFAGAEPVVLPTEVDNGYRLTPEQLDSAINERTKLLVLCSPSNPTGTVYTPDELQALVDVLQNYPDVFVLSDEIYEYVVFDATHRSIASFPGMMERTITVNGFSKAYAMTGWRLGYMAAPEVIKKAAALVQGQLTSAPSSISQKAGLKALEVGLEPVTPMVEAFRERRDYVLSQLNDIPGLRCSQPEGAFYLFPDVSDYIGTTTPVGTAISSSEDLCFYLLDEFEVALVQGEAFGMPYGLRLSYAASMDQLKEATARLKEGFASLRD